MIIRFLFVLSLFCMSCNADDIVADNAELGYDYFPIDDLDDTKEYLVIEVTYANEGKDIETNQYYQREVVAVKEGTREQSATNRIDIYRRINAGVPWLYSHSSKVEMDALQVISETEGERIVQLTFPVAIGKEWDGLVFLNSSVPKQIAGENVLFYKDWDFSISGVNEQHESYTDVLVVTEADAENAIEKRYSISKYSRDIGLVYRQRIILDSQCIQECAGMPWEEKAYKGMIYTKQLIN